jgi:ATP-dependent DNA helicase RecG
MDLTSPVTAIPGVGDTIKNKLSRLGITSVFDLLYHLPFRYEDRTPVTPVTNLKIGETATVIGQVVFLKNEYTKTGKIIQVGQIRDDSGSVMVLWFNQPFLTRTLKKGELIGIYGKVDFYKSYPAVIAPEYEIIRGEALHLARLVPVYPETAGISSKWLRVKIHTLLAGISVSDILPGNFGFMPWKQALDYVHFPPAMSLVPGAKSRLAFDELFLLQLTALKRRQLWDSTRLSHPFDVDQEKVLQFINTLPFTLTLSQNQSIREILADLSRPRPMNRLLEGDVGSGKTVVAAVAAYVSYLNGFRTLLMAPTQILAAQHFETLSLLFKPLGIKINLITGSRKISSKNLAATDIFVGTHALITARHDFDRVGLVVIDEQHRFGVTQRSLAGQLGHSPHTLTMTATPIPRTVALSMYGDLDLSVLTEKPTGRLPVKTWVVPENKRRAAYNWISGQLVSTSSQAFLVCPFIQDSETLTSVKAATAEYERLTKVFPELRLGLIHGKMKSPQKEETINRFRSGDINILVATPVVEVGLDIPNATIMVIEGAERFGLAQLHQLRGRVGRGASQSYCLLFTSEGVISPRLKAMEKYSSGLQLAETDLRLRGPGEIFGTAQHGFPRFKVAGFDDLALIETAKKAAAAVYPDLDKNPLLRRLIKEDKIQLVQPN